ncbi:MaoC family dehydratase N-terminal domain-containing protein [Arthrobacter sp. NPDC093139]|uniref:FAS1-like dehydratase domain-containing protein n=1 Tax=Arthrobacter sp. NPDC093139 TaxID=3363945 RepID=UPI00380AD3E5
MSRMEQERITELLTPQPAIALANLIGAEIPDHTLPPLWNWVYLLARRPHNDLGPDGHPTSGVPAPPASGQRRMFAGGRVTTYGNLCFGEEATRLTQVLRTTTKQGKTGPLTFVTVRNEVTQKGEVRIIEDNDIVYRGQLSGTQPEPMPGEIPEREARLDLKVDEALLFRFSALTYNAHRIHYDHHYAGHEGYDGLVVHGPLQALMMGELLRRSGIGLTGKTFAYRLLAPMVGVQTLSVVASEEGLASGGANVLNCKGVQTATSSLAPIS